MDSSSQRHDRYAILKIIGIYIFFGVLWIYFSDTVLAWLVRDANVMTYVQISKGILFILITASLLYVLIHTYMDRLMRMNRTLQEREILLHSIATNIPGVAYQFVATDAGGCNVNYVSEKLTETFGLSTEIDAFFPMFADHVVEEDRNRFLTSLREAVVSGTPWRFEGRFVKPDGDPLWFQAIATPKKEGPSILYHGVLLDITERKRAEEDLRRLNFAIERAAESVLITDPDGVIQYVNPAFEKVTGYSRSEAIGRTPSLLKSGVQDHSFYENLWKTLKGGMIWSGRMTNRRKDGKLIQADSTISPLVTSAGVLTGYISLNRDITEAVKLETMLRQAQKMEAIGTLAGGIAHDFNNILSAMIGYAELARFRTTDPQIQPYLEQILKACDRSRDLVKQILTFSRRREQEMKPMVVTPVVKEVLQLLRSSIPSTVEIRTSFETHHDTVLADPTQIHQVLMNLCTNAVHAMRDREGVLEVRLGRQLLTAQSPVFDPGLKEGPYLKMVVSDTGEGIDPSVRDKIFDPFFTTKASGEGTGLGLSVVYGIIKDHGGMIHVESEPGKGTTFTIHLPLLDAATEWEGPEMALIPEGSGHILYVDDEEPIASLGREMLTSLGYDVAIRLSSIDALEAFRANPRDYDLVITDMTMPNMTGARLAEEMLKIRPDLPIILTTGFSERMDKEAAQKLGCRDFLMKPVSLGDLARAVKRALGQESEPAER
ncbi:MAG TPA: PAS domain S-box protein [Syntrophales bacterium]|mgnify:CR=1 FL=1|nr:PAS domain S-box protein [Syntrophales bacterium]